MAKDVLVAADYFWSSSKVTSPAGPISRNHAFRYLLEPPNERSSMYKFSHLFSLKQYLTANACNLLLHLVDNLISLMLKTSAHNKTSNSSVSFETIKSQAFYPCRYLRRFISNIAK